jgi:hypothetical protein
MPSMMACERQNVYTRGCREAQEPLPDPFDRRDRGGRSRRGPSEQGEERR